MLGPLLPDIPDRFERAVLRLLSRPYCAAGLTSTQIAQGSGLGDTGKLIVLTRIHTIQPMVGKGWLSIEAGVLPALYRLTPEGRAALGREAEE